MQITSIAMRTAALLALAFLLTTSATGQDLTLHGVSLGDPLPKAMSVLQDSTNDIRKRSTEWSYKIEAIVRNRTITVAAPAREYDSWRQARVSEISSSLSTVDVSSQELVETYNKYKELWSEGLGRTSPTKRGSLYFWSWETEDIEANITYTEQGANPHSVDLSISTP